MHRNQLYKQTNKLRFCMYFFFTILYSSTRFERLFHSLSVHNLLHLQLCTKHANVPNCLVLRLELVQDCRINTYKKHILLVSLYNFSRYLDRTVQFNSTYEREIYLHSKQWNKKYTSKKILRNNLTNE